MHPIILSPKIVADKWFTEKPQRLIWWSELVMAAAPQDGCIMTFKNVRKTVNRGELIITRGMLAKRWCVSSTDIKNFLSLLTRKRLCVPTFYPLFTHITICEYESYVPLLPTFYPLFTQNDDFCEVITHIVTQPSSDIATDCESALPTQLPTSKISEKEEKDEKEKNQKKKKTKEETSSASSDEDTVSPTRTCEDESAEERKPGTRRTLKSGKEASLVTRGKEVFESFYKELYDESYYWQTKDAAAMKQLFQKISYSRKSRKNPLPVDDDSLVSAFSQFLRSINKEWIMDNFSLPKINSQYNDIIAEIKNKRNGTGNQNRSQAVGANIIANQRAAVLDDIAKADELYYKQ